MLKLEIDRRHVGLEASGPLKLQLAELMTGVHAWCCNVANEMKDPAMKEALRQTLLVTLCNDKLWGIEPSRVERTVEVDKPEELMKDDFWDDDWPLEGGGGS